MRASIAAGIAIAATASAQFLQQAGPFALVAITSNETYNGTTFQPCHEGAAIEGLCVGAPFATPYPTTLSRYYLNYSSSLTINTSAGTVTPGYITYLLETESVNETSPMSLSYSPTSNVAVPLFEPTPSGTEVAFNSDGLLGIPSYTDDTVVPTNVDDPQLYQRWYICQTDEGYPYTSLAWALGVAAPENPTCVETAVLQVSVGIE
jgi:hypothetical protein